MNIHKGAATEPSGAKPAKRPYQPPVLQNFGKIIELIQATSGDCMNDNAFCMPPSQNMAFP